MMRAAFLLPPTRAYAAGNGSDLLRWKLRGELRSAKQYVLSVLDARISRRREKPREENGA